MINPKVYGVQSFQAITLKSLFQWAQHRALSSYYIYLIRLSCFRAILVVLVCISFKEFDFCYPFIFIVERKDVYVPEVIEIWILWLR